MDFPFEDNFSLDFLTRLLQIHQEMIAKGYELGYDDLELIQAINLFIDKELEILIQSYKDSKFLSFANVMSEKLLEIMNLFNENPHLGRPDKIRALKKFRELNKEFKINVIKHNPEKASKIFKNDLIKDTGTSEHN